MRLGPAPLQSPHPYYDLLRPYAPHRYSDPRGVHHLNVSLGIGAQVLTFRTRAWLSFAPPTCRMTLGQSQDIPQADPGGRVTPRFCHRLISFRHFISGLLALVSLNRACQNHVLAIPQRSQPLLLTMAACGGLRSAPDCRPRRAYVHLSHSCASPFGPVILATHGQQRNWKVVDTTVLIPGILSKIRPRNCPNQSYVHSITDSGPAPGVGG
jgi:hypothetical protein